MSNHPNHDQAMKLASTVGANIRTLRVNSQTMLRALVVAIAVENFDQKSTLDAAKANMKYAKCETSEQALIRRQLSNVRAVVEAYALLSDDQKAALASGAVPSKESKAFTDNALDVPATAQVNHLAKLISDRDKAIEKAAKDADTTAPESETEETESAPPSDETPADSDDTAHIMATIALIEGGTFSDDQMAAIALLFDTVDAYRERIVEAANAA